MSFDARLTDIWVGICCCHEDPECVDMSGPIITYSQTQRSGNLNQARLTDVTMGDCGHTGYIITGSTMARCDGLPKARIGDFVIGCNIGIIVFGNSGGLHQLGG
jgi:uncharacterized Zn-binding protein involved in type VI secretion